MTHYQIKRLAILIITIAVVGLGGRELYFARKINQSSMLADVTISGMAKKSDLIVKGVVTKKLSAHRTTINDNLAVETDWIFTVEEAFKGLLGKEITLRIPGGRVGLTEMIVEDQPTIELNQPLVLFLNRDGDVYRLSCSIQGYFKVGNDSTGKPTFTPASDITKSIPINTFREAIQ
jgi:hypothetical protein